MFSLSCHTRYGIDALMDYPMGILVQKLILAESESKGFLCDFFSLFWGFCLFVFLFLGELFVLFWLRFGFGWVFFGFF